MSSHMSIIAAVLALSSAATAAGTFDMVVAGGTAPAVVAAEMAAQGGRRVLLLAPRSFLGEDSAGNLTCLEAGVTPLEAKRSLDRRLLSAGVHYLTGALVVGVDVLPDDGVSVSYASKDGVRTVRARAFADHRLPVPVDARRFARIVVSETPPAAPGLEVTAMSGDYTTAVTNRVQEDGDGSVRIVHGRAWRCAFTLPFAVTDVWTRAEAEIRARELTWTPNLLAAADELICLDGKGRTRPSAPSSRSVDVAVAGGGVAGAPAAVAAARAGARTVVCEFLHQLGGMGTAGGIGQYWQGRVQGFTAEYDARIRALGSVVHAVGKRETWLRMCRDAGATVLFGALVCGVQRDGERVTALEIATDYGMMTLRAGAVVDATGSADVAAAAGAKTVFPEKGPLCLQGAGLAPCALGAGFANSDFGYVDASSAEDLARFAACGRLGAPDVWDVATLVGARERRRIVGDITLTPEDVRRGRHFVDAVVQCRSNFDSHGPTACDLGLLAGPDAQRFFDAAVPYRALLPRGVAGVIVPGLGMAALRDAMPVLRMQPDVQNAGYAAGCVAARAAENGGDFRAVDVRAIQRHLVVIGNLDADVLSWRDPSVGDEELRAAVATLAPDYRGVEVVLAERERVLPLLKTAFADTMDPRARLVYAHTLGVLGCADGADVLADWLEGRLAVPEPTFDGKWAFARRFPYRDSVIVALGRTRTARARVFLERVAKELGPQTPFFRFRAVCWALATCGDKASAAVLLEMARRPGVTGHVKPGAAAWRPLAGYTSRRHSMTDEEIAALKELDVATAIYRLTGDASLLAPWRRDGRCVFADYAERLLEKEDCHADDEA